MDWTHNFLETYFNKCFDPRGNMSQDTNLWLLVKVTAQYASYELEISESASTQI